MDSLKDLMDKRSIKPNKNLHSPAHVLADEITVAFGEPKLFGRYLGVILRTGVGRSRAIFRTIQQDGGAKEPGKLFMFLCKKSLDERVKKPGADKKP